jgi:hypothetical protein
VKGIVPTYYSTLFKTVLIYTAALGVPRLYKQQIVKHLQTVHICKLKKEKQTITILPADNFTF